MSSPLLEIRDVGYRGGDTTILDGVSWRVHPGEHWAILGPNGAGKTTLLRIACGYLWPNAGGEVRRLGQPLTDLRELRRSIGWVSIRLAAEIPPHEAVLDTVVSGRVAQVGLKPAICGPRPTADDYEQARRFLTDLDCSALVDRRFGVLSQGEQQKVLIARALMAVPLLVFLDEPCAGLDPGARERFLESLERLASGNTAASLVLVTHHIEEIMPSFQNTLAMRTARVLRSGPTRKIVDAQLVQELYSVAPRQTILDNGRTWIIF
ncbi:MAG: ATP-binding cassette domain-containing protein [Pirellulaceae bacterium]|nr:ATP-binding cassette domain-containing protein [Pirellulaceae bacterium]